MRRQNRTGTTGNVKTEAARRRTTTRSRLGGLGLLVLLLALCATLLPSVASATGSGHSGYGHGGYGYASGGYGYGGYGYGYTGHGYGGYGYGGYGYGGGTFVLVCHQRSDGEIVPRLVRPWRAQRHINHGDPAPQTFYRDRDRDGFTPTNAATRLRCAPNSRWIPQSAVADCDDHNPWVSPAATEVPGNGIDDDCDPSTPDVVAVNTPPVMIPIADQSSSVDEFISLNIGAGDADGDMLTFSAMGLPAGLSVNGPTIIGTATDAGTYQVVVTVTDGQASDTTTFTWDVVANSVLVIDQQDDQANVVGDTVSLPIGVTDSDGIGFSYSASGLPLGLSLTPVGVIVGSPTTAGTYMVTVSASNGSVSDSTTFIWQVTAPVGNSAPVIDQQVAQSSVVGDSISLSIGAVDADGDALSFTATGLPPGLAMTGNAITGNAAGPGTFMVTVTVSDGQASDTTTFLWSVSGF